jgi:hypothetical protein
VKSKPYFSVANPAYIRRLSREILLFAAFVLLTGVILYALASVIQSRIIHAPFGPILFVDAQMLDLIAFQTMIVMPGIMFIFAVVIYVRRWRQ